MTTMNCETLWDGGRHQESQGSFPDGTMFYFSTAQIQRGTEQKMRQWRKRMAVSEVEGHRGMRPPKGGPFLYTLT